MSKGNKHKLKNKLIKNNCDPEIIRVGQRNVKNGWKTLGRVDITVTKLLTDSVKL